MLKRDVLPAVSAAILLLVGCFPGQGQQVPRRADFTISGVDGKPIPLAHYRGKAVVLAFILTTCPHCQQTIQLLSKQQQAYGARGLQVLASAIDQGAQAAVPLFIRNFHPPFPVGFNTNGDAVLNFCGYTPERLPHMPILLFIDRQGTIRAQHEGAEEKEFFNDRQEDNLRAAIEGLLGGAAGRKSAPVKKSE
jgi:peroxiredoxin